MDQSAAGFESLQIDFYRIELKPQTAWKGGNQNKNLLYWFGKWQAVIQSTHNLY